LTYSEVQGLSGEPGNFRVKVLQKPRYIDVDKCTGCGDCARVVVNEEHPPKEKDGLLWVDRIDIDEVKCIHCGDCARTCATENPEAPAMTNVVRERFKTAEEKPEVIQDYTVAQRVLAMPKEERKAFWDEAFSRCVKCYGCIEVCPIYVPRDDGLDPRRVSLGGTQPPAPYPLFHLLRAFNVWDTCIVCGECEKTCPADIPLKALQDMVVFMDPDKVFEAVPGVDEATKRRILEAIQKRHKKLLEKEKEQKAV
jgi:heterodisulfide reductase subunit A-like polyferredoxin